VIYQSDDDIMESVRGFVNEFSAEKTKNADRSPYATENDRHKNLKGLCLILRNFGRGSACLLKKYLILSEKSGFFFGKFSEGFIRNLPACCESCCESDGYLFTGILINDGVVKGFFISIGDFINDSGMMRIFQSVIIFKS